ncbi:MAG: penicillin-binding protein 1C [Candidatus Binataceae bacterium]
MRYRAAMVLLLAMVLAWYASTPRKVPSFADVRANWRPSDVQLLDRHGDPVYEMRIDSHGRRLAWTPLDEISPALRDAVVESEDHRFYTHQGVDAIAAAGAAFRWLTGRRARGTSTIAMQLAAMLDPSLSRGAHRRSVVQKLLQMRAALALERSWSKPEILEAYLNLVTWRGEIKGIGAASRVMFGKASHGITTSESLVMAALLRAPNAGHDTVLRRSRVLRASGGTSAPSTAELAAAVDQVFASHRSDFARITLAPHVAARLLNGNQAASRCALDRDLQSLALESLKRHVAEVLDRNVDDGAVLVAENATGQVWAYVGSAGDFSSAPWVDGVRAIRQPGSALKPFLYALAFDRRLLTAASLIEDTPLEVSEQRGLYRPMDYDKRFRGLVSARTALASSLNVPAVRTVDLVGVDAFAENLRALGINGVVEEGEFYGAALALGSADVTLWDLVNAYRTLANGGVATPLTLNLENASPLAPRQIYSREAAFIVSDILADRAGRSETFGLENSLATRYWSAVKTGTSKDMRDNWCVGYTDRFTVGVWVGNVTGAPMRDVTGITGAAPVWLDVVDFLHDRYGSGAPAPPPQVISRPVSFANSVEPARTEWFFIGTEPGSTVARLDDRAPRVTSPADGTIIALDPDIPADQQRVIFRAGRGAERARWVLDGTARCKVSDPCLWKPTTGPHSLALVDTSGRTLDHITFEVRGHRSEDPPSESQ